MSAIGTQSYVVMQDSPEQPAVTIFRQWLEERGHRVKLIDSPEGAIASACGAANNASGADLLVLTLTDPSEQAAAIDRLGLMPPSQRPKHVAILSEDEPDVTLRRRLPGLKLHLLGYPIQALGLLEIAKRMM